MSRLLCAVLLMAALDAVQIVQESQRRSQSASERYEGTLQVINSRGKVSEKRWRYERTGSHGNSKSVIRFTAPAEVKGVAILVVNHPDRASDQWMWIPAEERDRRIALQDRRTRFFGTDFSFEDLEERDVEQYNYKLLGEEAVEGAACWRIESRPKESKRSQYTLSIVWVRKDNYAFAKVENYSKDKLVRRLDYHQIEKIQGLWTARVLEMADLTRNSRTILKLEKVEYNTAIPQDDFTLQGLRREGE